MFSIINWIFTTKIRKGRRIRGGTRESREAKERGSREKKSEMRRRRKEERGQDQEKGRRR